MEDDTPSRAPPPLQPDPLARLFLAALGVVVAHGRGALALDCWRCTQLCRETRFVLQRGTLADLLRGALAVSGVARLLAEARACRRAAFGGADGTTQLLRAVMCRDAARVRLLLRLGCPAAVVNAQDTDGWTALNRASERGGLEVIVRELLEHGADANLRNGFLWTPLMEASYGGCLAVVRLLGRVPGLNVAARSGGGRTALGLARLHNKDEVAAFLRALGAPD